MHRVADHTTRDLELGTCQFCGDEIHVQTAVAKTRVILPFGECLICRRFTAWTPVDVFAAATAPPPRRHAA
jgi:hypothetical protein